MKPLVDARKLFSITTVYDENFLFPGSGLPGPDAPVLTEDKEYDGKVYTAGDRDPEWRRPDEENIPLGEIDGRFYYSIRADIDSSIESLGDIGEEIDPQTLETVPHDLYVKLYYAPAVIGLKSDLGITSLAPTQSIEQIQASLADNPEFIEEFLDQLDEDQFLAKLGIFKE
jgi:hypothetical protein